MTVNYLSEISIIIIITSSTPMTGCGCRGCCTAEHLTSSLSTYLGFMTISESLQSPFSDVVRHFSAVERLLALLTLIFLFMTVDRISSSGTVPCLIVIHCITCNVVYAVPDVLMGCNPGAPNKTKKNIMI